VHIKHYRNNPKTKPNVVVFILESYGGNTLVAFNKDAKVPDYKKVMPHFCYHSTGMIFYQCITNGRQSIHGMSSVLAVPSFKDAFTSSLSKQKLNRWYQPWKAKGTTLLFFSWCMCGSMGF
jgi:hypothetical protein